MSATSRVDVPLLHARGPTTASPMDVLLIALMCGYGLLGLRPLKDPDVWWHLRTGELVISSGFTTVDPWSPFSSNPWLLHEWGTEVLMYWSYSLAGYRGVILLHAIGLLVLSAVLLLSIRKEAGSRVSVVVGLLALIGMSMGTAERPQLVSWCLLAAILPYLRRAIKNRRPPLWLVPTIALWANLHGLWASAIVLYGCLVLGLMMEIGIARWRDYHRFVSVGVASLGAACLTPNGPALLLAPLHVREYATFVSEWSPPSLLNPYLACAYLLLALLIVTWARRPSSIPKPEIALVLGAAFIGLAYTRTMPVLVIVVAPLAAAGLQMITSSRPSKMIRLNQPDRLLATAVITVSLIGAALWIPQVPPVQRKAPWAASTSLDALPGRAVVFNEYALGGWLLWTARDTAPAIDGRTEIYDVEYVKEALDASLLHGAWQQFFRRHHFDAAWLYESSPLVYGLQQEGWTVMQRDDFTVILLPPPL